MIAGLSYRTRAARDRTVFAARSLRDLAQARSHPERTVPVTAVVVGRNDDYMADFATRLRATIDWNLRHGVAEVVFVEWNPPEGRELLSVAVAAEFTAVRCFVVPRAVHERLCRNRDLALLEYHAKNVGVRRATNDWILATNADVALAPDTLKLLRNGALEPDTAWTAQRVDIPWHEGRAQQVFSRNCLVYRRVIPYQPLGTGDFLLAHRSLWHRAGGYDESLVRHRFGCDIRGAGQMLEQGARLRRAGNILHLEHSTSCTEGIRPHHGEHAGLDGLPYGNPSTWGLADRREVPIGERIWAID